MSKLKRYINNKPWLVWTVLSLLVLAAFYWSWRALTVADEIVERSSLQTNTVPPPYPKAVETRLLITGDITWGRNNQRLAELSGEGPKHVFATLSTFNRDNYDAWIGNLECPVTDTNVSFASQKNDLIFNCQPSYLSEFAKWFNVVSLANNHTGNVNGQAGLKETRRYLQQAGIQYFGNYDPHIKSDQCEIVSLPARLLYSNGAEKEVSMPTALCGYQYVYSQPQSNDFDALKQLSAYLPTIVMPHMGTEYVSKADSLKTATYRQMVADGADLVAGSHPHWVQNAENYKGKLIMYSLGNFLFDQSWSSEVKKGLALDVVMHFPYDQNLASWLQLGPQCAAYHDDCLQQAKAESLSKPNIQFVYDIIASQYENGQTRRAGAAVQSQMEARTNWNELRLEFNPHD